MSPRRCNCGKVRSGTLDEARNLHARIWARRGGQANVRFYTCQHGAVHWTRQLEPIQ